MPETKKLNIVMFNMSSYSEWQHGVQNRNYHIIQTLLANERVNKIVAVDYLPHTFKRAIRNYKENIAANLGYQVLEKRLLSKVWAISDRLVVYSSVMSRFSGKKFYQNLNNFLQKKLGLEDYLVWSFFPLEVGYFKELKPKLFVFDAVDNWQEHPAYFKFKAKLKANYEIINARADLIFTVAEALSQLFSHQEKVHWLPNGVDVKHYQQKYSLINRDVGNLTKPIIGYVGTVQERFDVDLMKYLAQTNQDKNFVIIGPVWLPGIQEKLASCANVYFLGRKSYEEVPMYLQQFTVGIIPHHLDEFIKFTDPMKIYEYLACAKPIVTTAIAGLEQFKDLVDTADSYAQFNQMLNEVIKQDNGKLRTKRLLVAKEHSWLKRVERMLELIYQKI